MDLTVVIAGQMNMARPPLPAQIKKRICASVEEAHQEMLSIHDGWVMLLQAEDHVSEQFWDCIAQCVETNPEAEIVFGPRKYKNSHQLAAFSTAEHASGVVSAQETAFLHAWFLEGTVIRAELLKDILQDGMYGSFSCMHQLLLAQQAAAARGHLIWLSDAEYELAVAREGDKTFFAGVYDRAWYEALIEQYLLPHRELMRTEGRPLMIVQYQMAFLINAAVEANLNNVNKHLYEGTEAEALLQRFGRCLEQIDTEVILDAQHFPIAGKNASLRRWVYLILKKRDPHLEYEWIRENGALFYGYEGVKAGTFSEITADIVTMSYEQEVLTIEGRVSPLVYMHGSRFMIYANDVPVIPQKKERYALTKAFGISIYKLQSFHAEIPLKPQTPMQLRFVMEGAWGSSGVTLEFDSHFSRLTNRFAHSYWQMAPHTMMTAGVDRLCVAPAGVGKHVGRELALWWDMLRTGQKKVIKYIPVRLFMLMKPLLKKKPLWLFIDKIYRGGDSSEYLWRYVKAHDRDVQAYYLLDRKSPDYKRLSEAGEKPLIRHTLAHRRAFLYADWIIISNSTVFAFNDFSMKNSAYIRDLIHFKVACVQHGMSVQKIAVAQNRLRDHIDLYFCASKYEIENLSKPIYDYRDYDILQLTGVPRYDGLISHDVHQILISPTWRMQAAVPVTVNESVMRDYNPLFKDTSYYRLYNSLINDPRLLAAAKQYGYKIVYVLHPIVSAQIDDFEKNDQVTILQGGGDMNYEQLLCESSLMVTDYSGVQFDFAYMRKPVVYLHHREIPQHYEEGTFFYETMAFGEICHELDELVDLLTDYMSEGCRMKAQYVQRADDFFAYNDHDNCKRIYERMKQEDARGCSGR
jgi:CDP-glycerol glycerophosphotransferase (TagB/SpsB family)